MVLFIHTPAQRGKPILPSASDCVGFAVSDSFLVIVFNLPALLPEAAHCGGILSSTLPSQTILWFCTYIHNYSGTWVVLRQAAGAVNLYPELVLFQVSVPAADSESFGV